MGQQQTVAGSALRRMILVLAVAAVIAAMVAATATPAFAGGFRDFGGEMSSCGKSGGGVNCGSEASEIHPNARDRI